VLLANKLPCQGWGDGFLATLVNGSIGANFAHSGATTASFVAGGYWAKVLNAVKENKSTYHPYVTIQVIQPNLLSLRRPKEAHCVQFGHNDQKSTSGISISQFTANLEKMVANVRSAGGSPVSHKSETSH
jgi:lysophospholipase L1-like esterase